MEREQSIVCVAGMDRKKRRSGKYQGRMMRMNNQVKPGSKKTRLFLDFFPWLKSESVHIFYVFLRNKRKEFCTCSLLYVYLISFCMFSC